MSAERNCATWLERRGWQVNADGHFYKNFGSVTLGPMCEDSALTRQFEAELYGVDHSIVGDREQTLDRSKTIGFDEMLERHGITHDDLDKAEGEQ